MHFDSGTRERAREIAVFITPSGLYFYTVMPFGLRSALATFQQLMSLVVSDVEGCAVYLDDVVLRLLRFLGGACPANKSLFGRLVWARLVIGRVSLP